MKPQMKPRILTIVLIVALSLACLLLFGCRPYRTMPQKCHTYRDVTKSKQDNPVVSRKNQFNPRKR